MHHPHRTVKVRPLLIAVAAALAASAQAADETGKFYFNPQYGYTFHDADPNAEDGDHFAIGFGGHISDAFSVELNALFGTFDDEVGGELDQTAYSLDALAVFGRGNRTSPFISFGGGYLENDWSTYFNEYGPFVQAGAGVLFDLGENSAGTFVFQSLT